MAHRHNGLTTSQTKKPPLAKITAFFGLLLRTAGEKAIGDKKTPFYFTYTTPRAEMRHPVNNSTSHVDDVETYSTHGIFVVSVGKTILSVLTRRPLPS